MHRIWGNVKERIDLITKDTQEIVTFNKLKALIENNKSPRSYWGIDQRHVYMLGREYLPKIGG